MGTSAKVAFGVQERRKKGGVKKSEDPKGGRRVSRGSTYRGKKKTLQKKNRIRGRKSPENSGK